MKGDKRYRFSIPPWIIVGAVIILTPIFVFWTFENINKQKENMALLLSEKGAALIRSFEAGARTGMMGIHTSDFQLQRLLTETALQPDVVYLIITDTQGTILAHNDPAKIGGTHGRDLGLERLSPSDKVQWHQVSDPYGTRIFEVFRYFSPARRHFSRHHHTMMNTPPTFSPREQVSASNQIIFLGLDMGPIEVARKEDACHTILMASIFLLIGFGGIVSLFLAQAYRTAHTSLTRVKAFSDTVVENIPIGLLAIDTDRKVIAFNQAAESVLHLSSSEVLGKRADEVLPGKFLSLIDELNAKEGIIAREIDCTLENGKRIPLDASVSFLEGEDDSFLGNVVLFRDLTEVQNLKIEVETARHLASLGRLAAGIAHEIRNPLSSIKGFATYFKERYREIPDDQKTAEIMIQEVERLNRAITQLLEFARPATIQKKPTSMETVIQHSLKIIERDAQAKNISVRSILSTEIGDVTIDADKISQVLLNLYLNAIEAMEKGGILSTTLSLDEKDSKRVRIVVSDNGVGIPKKDLGAIFDPYYTTKQTGTGLGLAIVHRIIESHKGEIRVESEPNKGTAVTILLPFSQSENQAANHSHQKKGMA